MKQIEIDQFSQ